MRYTAERPRDARFFPAIRRRDLELPPMVVARAIVTDERGDILLVQRAGGTRSELQGRWELPGGKCDPGEVPDQGVAREVWEETGLYIARTGSFNPTESRIMAGGEHHGRHYLSLVCGAMVVGGELTPDPSEVSAAAWVPRHEIGGLALRAGTQAIVESYGF